MKTFQIDNRGYRDTVEAEAFSIERDGSLVLYRYQHTVQISGLKPFRAIAPGRWENIEEKT
jgi:hypothetical protein